MANKTPPAAEQPKKTTAKKQSRVITSTIDLPPEVKDFMEYAVPALAKKSMDDKSKQREDKYQETLESGGGFEWNNAVAWPYNFNALKLLPSKNSTLRQCIDVMVTNVHGNGYRLEYMGPRDKEQSGASLAEKAKLQAFLDNPNGDYSLTALRERLGDDYYTIGNGYIEIARNRAGEIASIFHIPGYTMHLTVHNPDPVKIDIDINIGDGKYRKKELRKKFRLFTQTINGQRTYFKEYGDPRKIDPKTGQVNNNLAFEDEATEIFHFNEYMAGSSYGLPRWFSQMPSILGSRQAELSNLSFFSENAIPAMAVLVGGGQLSEDSIDGIRNLFTSLKGRAAQNGVVVLEALGDPEGSDEAGRMPIPHIDLKPLAGERQQDGQFLEFDKVCRDKIRSAFRIPQILLGLSEDYNRATSDTSLIMAETQIFGPERRVFDEFMNEKILRQFKPKYWRFKSKPPRVAGTFELMETVKALEATGAMSPNKAVELMNEFLDYEVKPYGDKWADLPMKLVHAMAQNGMVPKEVIGDFKNVTPPPAAGGFGAKPVAGTPAKQPQKQPAKKNLSDMNEETA